MKANYYIWEVKLDKTKMENKPQKWHHPGGKLRELGAEALTDAELLSILIASGLPGKSAEEIAEEILQRFGGFKGIANQPLEKLLDIKGLGDVKIIRPLQKIRKMQWECRDLQFPQTFCTIYEMMSS